MCREKHKKKTKYIFKGTNVTMKQWMNIKCIHIVVNKHFKTEGQTHSFDIPNG